MERARDAPEIVRANLAIDQFTSNLDRLPTAQKAVLLVVIGYRQKGGVSKTKVGEIHLPKRCC